MYRNDYNLDRIRGEKDLVVMKNQVLRQENDLLKKNRSLMSDRSIKRITTTVVVVVAIAAAVTTGNGWFIAVAGFAAVDP